MANYSYTTTTLNSLDLRTAELYQRGRKLNARIKRLNKALDNMEMAQRVFGNDPLDDDAGIVRNAFEQLNARFKALSTEAETVWNHYEAIDGLQMRVIAACMESVRRQKA